MSFGTGSMSGLSEDHNEVRSHILNNTHPIPLMGQGIQLVKGQNEYHSLSSVMNSKSAALRSSVVCPLSLALTSGILTLLPSATGCWELHSRCHSCSWTKQNVKVTLQNITNQEKTEIKVQGGDLVAHTTKKTRPARASLKEDAPR